MLSRFGMLLGCLLLTTTISAIPAAADDRGWSLREYVQTTWTHRNGLPLAILELLTQTADGYLWFTVDQASTVIRFDGVQFTPVPVPCARLSDMAAGPDGSLWLLCRESTYRLLQRHSAGQVTEVLLSSAPFSISQPVSLAFDSLGRLWLVGDVVIRRDADGSFRELAKLPRVGTRSTAKDANGGMWVADVTTIIRIHDDRSESIAMNTLGLTRTSSGSLIVSDGGAVYRLNGASRELLARAPNGVQFSVGHVVDSTGAIWIGTRQHGIARIQDGRVETLPQLRDQGEAIVSVFLDREDNVWAASSAGLHRFRKPHARLLPALGGRVPPQPAQVFVDSRDEIWVGGAALVRSNLTTGASRTFDVHSEALAEDHDGRIWLATDDDLRRFEDGAFRTVPAVTGAPVARVRQFQADANGNLWAIANRDGIYQVTPGPPRRVHAVPGATTDFLISARHGVWVASDRINVTQLLADGRSVVHPLTTDRSDIVMSIVESGDAIWIATLHSVLRWRNGHWTRWTGEHGLPGRVQEIASDGRGRLWFMTAGGIVAVSEAELNAAPDGAPAPLRFIRIGGLDRVVGHPGNPGTTPRASMDRNGRIYFVTFDSVAVVDPNLVTESALRPTIVLESALVDNQPVELSAPGRLTAPTKLQFDYTSLSLRSPETIRFRYRLEGYDADWVEASGARQALYGTLPPGAYRFRVIGSGSEGVWNEEGASYAFSVVPLFYNTWWFRGAALLLVSGAVVAVHRLRVRRLTYQMQMQFEARLAERTRIARELHDTLLQGTLAASLHAQLADQALQKVPASPAIEQVRPPLAQVMELLAQVARDSRAVLSGLRSAPGTGDLAQLLHQAAGEQPNRGEIDFRVTVEGVARLLKPAIADDVALIAREAIVNAFQHSRARCIEVELVYTSDSFQCLVRDDGQGIEGAVLERGRDGHWGLAGMRERAERAGGELHVRSSATAGTEVHLSLAGRLAFADDTGKPRRGWRWRQ